MLAWRREKSDFKLWITGIADILMPMAYRERRGYGGWNADLFSMPKPIRNIEAQRIWQPTASNGESRIEADGYGSIGEYGQSKYGSYSINIIRSHRLQSATPVICRKTYESAMSFLSVILCDIKRSACHPPYQRYTWNTVR